MNGFLVSYYLHSNPLNNRVFLKQVAHASLPHGGLFSTCTVHMFLCFSQVVPKCCRDYHPMHFVRRACVSPEEKGQVYFNHFSHSFCYCWQLIIQCGGEHTSFNWFPYKVTITEHLIGQSNSVSPITAYFLSFLYLSLPIYLVFYSAYL